MSNRNKQNGKSRATTTIAALTAWAILAASSATPAHAARKPNYGLYASKYQMVVSSDAHYLVHPTGEYIDVDDHKWKRVRDLYEPRVSRTDDMDSTVLDLEEQGYVMIGYSAFSSVEAPDSPYADNQTDAENTGTRIGLWMRGYDPDMDMKGDPRDAAVWANASLVVVQEGYAFSRLETQMKRIITDDGKETVTMSGIYDNQHSGGYAGVQGGSSSTDGSSSSRGDWDENHQDVNAEVSADGPSVGGSAGQSEGSNRDRTNYNERSQYAGVYAGGQWGQSSGGYDDHIERRTRHWATALVDKHVNHYDYMVTFWKKADPDKFVLGAFTEPLPRDLMRMIGTRHARMIRTVVGGTPAYDADLWAGDVLLEINGEAVRGENGYSDLLHEYRGEDAVLTVWREGQVIEVAVELNDPR